MTIHYDGVDQYHSYPLTDVSVGTTYTMACWVRNGGAGDLRPIMIRNNKGAAKGADQFEGITFGFDDLSGGGPSDGGKLHAVTYLSSASYAVAVATTVTTTAGVPYHVAATFRDGTQYRRIWVDGVNEASNNTTKNLGFRRVSYAVLERTANSRFYHIEMAEPAIWNVALSTVEIAALAAGALPIEVRPAALKKWSRHIGAPPQNLTLFPASWTTGGTPTSLDHVPLSEPAVAIG